ncbi:hypothetical protein HYY71_06480 [Candidatus Woesearchaeota archaeon]|nr:hypothetical protein [Candidatus Woesearchaeota archaeon]
MVSMNKKLLSVLVLLVVSIAACQQAAKEPVMEKKADVMEKKEEAMQKETPAATGEAAVDAVGNDLTNVDAVEKDLSSDELGDLDAGLADVQNI